jgi:hypothetical protein
MLSLQGVAGKIGLALLRTSRYKRGVCELQRYAHGLQDPQNYCRSIQIKGLSGCLYV